MAGDGELEADRRPDLQREDHRVMRHLQALGNDRYLTTNPP